MQFKVVAKVLCAAIALHLSVVAGYAGGWDSQITRVPKVGSAAKKKPADTTSSKPKKAGSSKSDDGVRATGIRIRREGGATHFELSLSKGVAAELFTLADPYRLIIDLPETEFDLDAKAGAKGKGLVSAFRYGLFAEGKARIVVDTSQPVAIRKAIMRRAKSGYRLSVEMVSIDAAQFGKGTGQSAAASQSARGERKKADTATVPKRANRRPVIVIDAGHGGVDPGASSADGLAEKKIALAVAKWLRKVLAAYDKFELVMTRDKDVFVSLDERLKISRDSNADMFISLHADAIGDQNYVEKVRGATIYTLSDNASDEEARRMAEKENASDVFAGLASGSDENSGQVRGILIDLLKRETANFSAAFSKVLLERLRKNVAISRKPLKSAAFKVLRQTHAPSVLVELGYMSNTKDRTEMVRAEWQQKAARAIARAVQTYFSKRIARQR